MTKHDFKVWLNKEFNHDIILDFVKCNGDTKGFKIELNSRKDRIEVNKNLNRFHIYIDEDSYGLGYIESYSLDSTLKEFYRFYNSELDKIKLLHKLNDELKINNNNKEKRVKI